MVQRSRLSTTLCGVAGEYFVAAELSRRGYVASLTLRNTRGIDILASNSDATKSVGIQVKAIQGSAKEWMLNQKIESEVATNLFYVFIRLNDLANPEYFVVPKEAAAAYAKSNHERWLATLGRKGQAHNETTMRKFADPELKYLNRWDLLGLGEA